MKFVVLGSGSSVGVPWITGNWGNCNKKNKYNKRTRCSAFIKKGKLSILIDTSPDIKKQFLDNKINNVDYVLYTHEHADQTSGIFELRPFFWKNKKRIDIYANKETLRDLFKKHDYCFVPKQGYVPILNGNLVKKDFLLSKDLYKLKGLKYLILDCLKFNSHPSHFNFSQALKISKKINAQKTILTNLHSDLDYKFLKKSLPKNIVPAYDGMTLIL